ncbi:protein-export membrane protein SecF [Novimethylophilus kurashikiensis]|uniref:Protein-export membrane protein SecF n=1 Tax=Novimethylophilus kurashikiensis TaxID=1825523 RepID=A0A2R5FCX7_9PROT|nr:YHS domain-containing protein [Novimethylophilus kurashikiensis]GBG14783.1 protein-export membrane protein SecF [Novimethylophilus kurashikiensis]
MAWLSQNWGFLLLIAGVFFLMHRGGMGCGHFGGSHQHGKNQEEGAESQNPTPNVDPVNGQKVDMQTAAATVYQGKTYYFSSRENRDRFEANPQQYIPQPEHHHEQGHHHGGCC